MHATAARTAAPAATARAPRGVLQRKCACGGTPGPSDECAECRKKRLTGMQRKLRVGGADDRWEREADQVADRVMGTSGRGAAPLPRPAFTPLVQRRGEGEGTDAAPPIVHEVLASPGRPLDAATRSTMEARFGHDFGRVRVHTDARAARSASAVGARAYTVGRDVVFAAGEFAPAEGGGGRLLAHELAHVVQQGEAGAIPAAASAGSRVGITADAAGRGAVLRRACGPAAIGSPAGCAVPPDYGFFVAGSPIYRFDRECDDFAAGEEARLLHDAAALPATATMEIHGFASVDGPAAFNHDLACARARAARTALVGLGPLPGTIAPSRILGLMNHGPTPGPAADRRSVVLVSHATPVPGPIQPEEPPAETLPKCGPDATDWFVDQVNAAMTDPAVLSVQRNMARADALARSHGTTAHEVAEGGAAAGVLAQYAKLTALGPTPPAWTPTPIGQVAVGAVSGARAASALTPTSPFDSRVVDVPLIAAFLAVAALGWKSLVDHAARYDFKAHADSMNHPSTPSCPTEGCDPGEVGIVTLCPGDNPQNCYESDLPGNLFYALIGKHVGFSELTLQLGSQMAELTDTTSRPSRPNVTWDSPQDTAAIALGFSLPLPLTRSAFCSTLSPARSRLAARTGCDDCLDPTPSVIR